MASRLGAPAVLLGILVSLACVGLLSRQVDLAHAWTALSRVRGPPLLLPLAAFLLSIPLRARRWQVIFPAGARPRFYACLSVLGIGNMANFLLPARAGDVTRCVLLGRSSLAENSRALGTLAVEKIVDGLALVAMVLFSVWSLRPPRWVTSLVWAASLIFGGALVVVIVLRGRAPTLIAALERVLGRAGLPRLGTRVAAPIAAFAEGLVAARSAGQLMHVLALTAAIWATEVLLIWGFAVAFGLGISVGSAAVVSAVLGLALMVPAAPGGLGTYELAGTAAFQLAGVGASSALAVTVVIHAWVLLANTALGLGLLAARGARLAQLKAQLAPDPPA